MLRLRLLSGCLLAGIVASLLNTTTFADTLAPPPHNLGTIQKNELGSSPLSSGLPSVRNDAGAVMQPVEAGDIVYITGGIGDEERAVLESTKDQYNLRIMSASRSGAFIGDTEIILSKRNGEQLLTVDAGPLFYAKLPAGSYIVKATADGRVKKQNITIHKEGATPLHFSW